MSDDLSPVLALPLIQPAQAQKHVTHNEAIRLLDVLVQPAVASRSTATPPADPAPGARYIVPAGALAAWAGQDGTIALAEGGGWAHLAPLPGWQAWVEDEAAPARFDGTAWTTPAEQAERLARLGVGTDADATNRLAVAAPASLFTHDGAGHQLKINKAGAADTASLLFQTGWSGRAEIGTTGSDALAVKVSADGAAWVTALALDAATGLATGAAVTQSATDATPGRLLRVGDFGLGGNLPLRLNIGVTDSSLPTGIHAYDTTAGSSGGPAHVTRGTLIHARRTGGGGETQLMVVEAGNGAAAIVAGMVLTRSRVAGAWSDWRWPGIAESATNANGRYIRHQDGTQICWQIVTTLAGGEVAATFPAAFAGTADLRTTLGVNSGGVQSLAPRQTGRTLTGMNISCFNTANTRVATAVEAVTIGRWF